MHRMRQLWKLCLVLFCIPVFLVCFLSACGNRADQIEYENSDGQTEYGNGADQTKYENGTDSASETLLIETTIFPIYDWTRQIIGKSMDHVQLNLLLDNGVDMHSFQPSAQDIRDIASCDLLIYIGGESDEWIEDVVREAENPDLVSLNLMKALGDRVKEEEEKEGMQGTEHSGQDTDGTNALWHEAEPGEKSFSESDIEDSKAGSFAEADETEQEEAEYDEHIWLSLENAQVLVQAITEALSELDEAHAAQYAANAQSYQENLKSLDSEYRETIREAAAQTLVFADRFPFRYLVDDYGLDYYAAFPGCSAETEASFGTLSFLIEKLNELSLPAVLTIDDSDQRIAKTIAANTRTTDQQILNLDSMQSVTGKELDAGITYLQVMEENLAVLEAALNR